MARGTAQQGRKAFVVDNVVVFGAQILSKLRGLLVLPVIVTTLGAAAYGTWSQAITFASLASAVVGLSYHLSLVRLAAANDADRGTAFSTLLSASVVILGTVSGLLLLSPESFIQLCIGSTDRALFGATLGLLVTAGLRNLILNLLRATGHLILRSAIDLVSSLLDLVVIIAVLRGGHGLYPAMVASLVVNVLAVACYVMVGFRIAPPRMPSWKLLWEATRYGLPLVPATLAMCVLDRGDRFVISHWIDQEAVGVYSAQYTLGTLLMLVLVPIQTTLVPKVAQLWDSDRDGAGHYVAACFRFFFAVAVFFVAVIPLTATALLTEVGSSTLAQGATLNVAAVGAGAALWGLGVIVQMPLFGSKNTAAVGAASAAGAVFNLVANVVLVPRFGIMAAALTTTLTYLLTYLLFARATGRIMTLDLQWSRNLRSLIAAVVTGGLVLAVAPSSLLSIVATLGIAAVAFVVLALVFGAITQSEKAAATTAIRRLRQRGAPQ